MKDTVRDRWYAAAVTAAVFSLQALQGCSSTSQVARLAEPTGSALFASACAGCHGANAQGGVAVIPGQRVVAPDLTRIAARRGTFSDEEIFKIVDGQADLSAHGPRYMPVWGYEFFGQDPDDQVAHGQAVERVQRLVAYLRSLQQE